MPWKFNPFSNTLDQTGSGGGGSSYIDGEVQNFSALPETVGTPPVDSAYLVREAEGAWLLNRKPAGIYIRTADTGVRVDDWTHAGAFPDVFSDANFLLYDNDTPSKNLQFQLSGIAAATTRTITMPDANVTLPDQGTSTGDTPTFAKVTINDTVNDLSTLTLANDTGGNNIEFEAQELTLRHTGTNDTPYINVTDGTDYALLGVRQGDMFLQGSNAVVRIEQSGGVLADIKVNKLVLEDATTSGGPTATFDADGNLTANRTYDLPDSSGTIALTSQLATGSTDNAILRADGTGGAQTQASGINVDDATTSTANNVTISNQHSGQTNSSLVLQPKGTGAFILGPKPDGAATGGNARGERAIDLQINRTAATQVASGNNGVVLGQNNTAGGNSLSIGDQNSSTGGFASIALGSLNTANAPAASVLGRESTSSATWGVALAYRSRADRNAMLAFAGGRFSSNGDAQNARFVLRCTTTTTGAVEMFLGDTTTDRLTIPSNKTMGGTIQICGTTSGGETSVLYIRQFLIRNRGGTTGLIGSIQTVGTDIEGIDLTNPSLTANDANDSLKIEVTGYTPVTGCTAAASTDVISKTAHGFSNNDDIVFTSLTGGAGLTANTVTYWVINANANDFQVSVTRGGAAVNITTDYSDMTATRVIRWVGYVDATEVGHGT
jgi:hypothetical protein